MRYSAVVLAAVATLAVAAPTKSKRQSLADLIELEGQGFDVNEIVEDFSSNSLNQNDIEDLLEGFDVNGFNNEFDGQFNDQEITQLLLSLEGNEFGSSNFNDIENVDEFNLDNFSEDFNNQFSANWNQDEIEQLLLELGLVNENQFSNQDSSLDLNQELEQELEGLSGNNNNFENSNSLESSSNVNSNSSSIAV